MEGTTSFDCPINMTPMVDPVMAADGHSYERTAIARWFREHPRETRSPCTNMVLDHKNLTPNHTLKKCMQDAKETAAFAHQTALHQKRGASPEAAGDAKRAKTPQDATAVFAADLKCMVYTGDVAGVLASFRGVLCSSLVMETRALYSLCELALSSKQPECELIVAGGGVQLVATCMRHYSDAAGFGCGELQQHACVLLQRLSAKETQAMSAKYHLALAEAGGIECLLLALDAHWRNERLAADVLQTLVDLAHLPKTAEAGAMRCVSLFMLRCRAVGSGNTALLARCCYVLGCLAGHASAHVETSGAATRVVEMLDFVVRTRVEDGDGLTFDACRALRVFCECPEFAGAPQGEAVGCLTELLKKKLPAQMREASTDALNALLLLVRGHANNKREFRVQMRSPFRLSAWLGAGLTSKQLKIANTHVLLALMEEFMPETCDDNENTGVVQVLRDACKVLKEHAGTTLALPAVRVLVRCLTYQRSDVHDAALRACAPAVLTAGIRSSLQGAGPATTELVSSQAECLVLLCQSPLPVDRAKTVSLVVEADGIRVAAEVLRYGAAAAGAVPSYVIDALRLVQLLCRNAMDYAVLVRADGPKHIVACISAQKDAGRPHVVHVVEMSLRTLQLTYGKSENFRHNGPLVLQAADIQAVVGAMKLHPSNEHIQFTATGTLSHFAVDTLRATTPGSVGVQTLAGVGAVQPVLDAMKAFNNEAMLEVGCNFLGRHLRLVKLRDEASLGAAVAEVIAQGASSLVLTALRVHFAKDTVRAFGLYVLALMCGDAGHRAVITADGGMLLALDALQVPKSNAQVVLSAFMVIEEFVRVRAGEDWTIADSARVAVGAKMRVMLKAMQAGATDTKMSVENRRDLLRSGLHVVRAVTADDAQCVRFALQGGVQVLVQLMQLDEQLHVNAMVQLLARVSRVRTLVMSVATAGGLSALLAFMNCRVRAKHYAQVLDLAVEALHSLALDPVVRVEHMQDPDVGVLKWVAEHVRLTHEDCTARGRLTELADALQ